jgi:hypothetical protein
LTNGRDQRAAEILVGGRPPIPDNPDLHESEPLNGVWSHRRISRTTLIWYMAITSNERQCIQLKAVNCQGDSPF